MNLIALLGHLNGPQLALIKADACEHRRRANQNQGHCNQIGVIQKRPTKAILQSFELCFKKGAINLCKQPRLRVADTAEQRFNVHLKIVQYFVPQQLHVYKLVLINLAVAAQIRVQVVQKRLRILHVIL